MSFDARMIHELIVERPTDGTADEWNTPASTYTEFAQVPGLVQPKRMQEIAQLNQAGATLSTHTIYTRPTEIQPSDRVRVAAGPMAGTYEIDGVRDAAGLGHHYEIDAHMVAV